MTSRHQEDFLGWAPADALEWAPEPSGNALAQPLTDLTPGLARPSAAAILPAPVPSSQRPTRPARQPNRTEPPRPTPGQQPLPAGVAGQAATPGRRRQPAGPLFGVTAIAAGMLLLFTIAMVIREFAGEGALGPVPIFAGAATLALFRAAAAMRSR